MIFIIIIIIYSISSLFPCKAFHLEIHWGKRMEGNAFCFPIWISLSHICYNIFAFLNKYPSQKQIRNGYLCLPKLCYPAVLPKGQPLPLTLLCTQWPGSTIDNDPMAASLEDLIIWHTSSPTAFILGICLIEMYTDNMHFKQFQAACLK